MEKRTFELLEWRDRRYQHVRVFKGSLSEAKDTEKRLNRGYTGPRFVIKEVVA